MRKLILSLCIFYVFLNLSLKPSLSKAQAYSCDYIFKNLIQNHDLNGTPGNSDEFATGCVPYWTMMETLNQGPNTPQLVGVTGVNTYSQQWSGWLPYNSSGLLICVEEEIGQKIQTEQNHRYYIGFKARRKNLGAGQGYIAAKLWDSSSHQYQVAIYSQLNNSGWTTFSTCVNPFRNFNYLTIYPVCTLNQSNPYGVFWVQVDSVTLYEVNPLMKNDTISCSETCFTKCVTVDSFYPYVNLKLFWYELTNPSSILSSSNSVTLCPDTTKSYVLKDSNNSCYGSDIFTITVLAKPKVNLGNDTIICGPANLTLDAGLNSSYRYLWNTGSTNHSINVTSSGKYWVKVIASDSCFAFDTINIVINPKFKMNPTDTIICLNSFPIRISVDSGYAHYSWSNGDTLHCSILESTPGKYWVTVTDSSGCSRTDTATINTIQQPFPYIGKDRYLCQGNSVTLCDSNLKISYLFHYQWYRNNSLLTGDSNRCLTVSDSGQYVLKAWTKDSCLGYDTVNVFVRAKPQITCNINTRTFCPNDPPELLSCNPSGGVYSGPGITQINNNWYFCPKNVFGTVYISYIYTTPDTPYCTDTARISMHVDSLRAIIEPIDPLCIKEQPVNLTGEPAGGSWNPSNTVNPSILGAGAFPFIYTYTSPEGCITSDTFIVNIIDSLNVNIIQSTSDSGCSNTITKLTADFPNPNNNYYYYHWSTGDSTKSIFVYSGTFSVTVSDSFHKCSSTANITVNSVCEPSTPATPPYNNDVHIHSMTTINGQYLVVDGNIWVDSTTLIIKNSHIIMRNCKKIIVTRKAKLVIDSSCISGCNWQGIEVWGWWDACPADSTEQGCLYADSMMLTGANIGIYVGNRDTFYPDPSYAGGRIKINHSHFKNNYVDIMFSPWTFDVVCQCSWIPYGRSWWSEIENSTFDTLTTLANCDNWVDNIINLVNITPYGTCINYNYIQHGFVLPLIRCHIMDLSPYVDVVFTYYLYSLCLNPDLLCRKWAGDNANAYFSPSNLSVVQNNLFIDNCQYSVPANFYYHN